MQQIMELEQKIDDIKYDIQTLQMEKTGYQKKLRFLKEKIIINISIFLIFLLFLKITILGDYNNPYSFAFIVVLKPIFFFMVVIYLVVFILKPIWLLYLNCNLKSARKAALRRGFDSISQNIEMCDAKISALNTVLRNYSWSEYKNEDKM